MFERFRRDAKVAMVLAQEDARELCGGQISPQHLLLGVVQAAEPGLSAVLSGHGLTADAVRDRLSAEPTGDDSFAEDAEALAAIGIDLRAVRDSVSRTFGDDAFDNALRKSGRRRRRRGHLPFTRSAKKALELAVRDAVLHKDDRISCEHVVLGVLRGGDPAVIDMITDPARLRAEVTALLDKAA